MPYTSPSTGHNPTTGNAIPASWGDDVNTALDYLATNFPHCSILESTAQSVANATEADLTSDEENSDIGGMHSIAANTERITIPASEGGLYLAAATVRFASDADGYRVLAIRKAARGSTSVSSREAAEEAMENIRWRFDNPGRIRGISTGFPEFDLTTDGLLPQEFVVVAARPGDGKTAFCIQIAEHIAFTLRFPVAFYSLEMSRIQFLERWIQMRAQVNPFEWRYRQPHAFEMERCEVARDELASAPITIEEGEGMSIQSLRASMRRLVREKKIRVIFVDSGSALTSDSKQAQFKHERAVADVTAGFKGASKELNVPVVALWHLGRQVEDGKSDEMPRLKDLRGGATVEQDADKVVMIVPRFNEGDEYPATMFLPKQRGGARRSKVEMMFRPAITSFFEPVPDPNHEQAGLGI